MTRFFTTLAAGTVLGTCAFAQVSSPRGAAAALKARVESIQYKQ